MASDRSNAGPAFTLICFANIEWTDVRQRHQILMEGLAGPNRRVYFVESLGVRAPTASGSDVKRVIRRVFRAGRGRVRRDGPGRQPERGPTGVRVIAPVVAPAQWALGRFLNDTILFSRLCKALDRPEGIPTVAWIYLPTPAVSGLLDRLAPDHLVYDCTINFRGHPSAADTLLAAEQRLLERADLVFADAEALFERCRRHNPNTHRLRPGVHWETFRYPGDDASWRKPAELDEMSRPLALFFGTAKSIHFDWRLLRSVARALPAWCFAILGPVDSEVRAGLAGEGNIHLLRPRAHSELPAFLWAADAIFLPYRLNEFTSGTFPAKIYEALASGTPVVSTPLPELAAEFSAEVLFGATPESFASALESALDGGHEDRARRMSTAETNSWDERIRTVESQLSRLVCG